MIYLVTKQSTLFESELYKVITVTKSLELLTQCNVLQIDTETNGRDAHINKILCIQFGNDTYDFQIVVDTSTIDINYYKDILESKFLILQNAKFDLQFLYSCGIIPRRIYDTMIVEQLLYLGFPYIAIPEKRYKEFNYDFPYKEIYNSKDKFYNYELSYSLAAIAKKRLNIDIDKTIRGEIIWRGLDESVIIYSANDVKYLQQIMSSQLKDLESKNLLKAAKIECNFIPTISYLEWCGIHLNEEKWSNKMEKDLLNLENSEKLLDSFVISNPNLKHYTKVNLQLDLFEPYDPTPKCTINWSSSTQVAKLAKELGFNTSIPNAKGEDKDSVMEKHLKSQVGINDEFLKLYFDYKGYDKVVTSFGQNHLNTINPITNRIHTTYRQLGCASGRMSCGSSQNNNDLAKLKGLPINPSPKQKKEGKGCSYPNMQQLPADDATRCSFTAPEGYLWSSCDYSALESRLGADIYNEKSMLDEFLYGSGDMHSLCAYMVYDEIPRDTPIKDIKKLYPKLRKEVKGIEFSQQFGGSEYAIQGAMGCSLEKALEFKDAYNKGFPGIARFKQEGSKSVREKGYILMCKYSGHKMYWWDHKEWLDRQSKFTQEFWETYRNYHKGTGDTVAQEVSMHFKAAAKWDRLALNSVTQGSGIVILKIAMTNFFNWIVDNGYFGKVEIASLVHDESNIIYPKELTEVPKMQQYFMEEAAKIICTKLPIPAEASVGDHWIH